jgi:hypothetical protein
MSVSTTPPVARVFPSINMDCLRVRERYRWHSKNSAD